MKPKVVLVTLFEPPDSRAGELTRFKEEFGLSPVPDAGPLRLFQNREGSLLALVGGVGAVQTACSVTALELGKRFDLSESLWLVAGVAGGDPGVVSLGSPVWTDWCVDGDLAWEIDAREMPGDWSTGILPLGAREPYGNPAGEDGAFGTRYEVQRLPTPILRWACSLTEKVVLDSTESARAEGRRYASSAAAGLPAVRCGATLSAVRFWHGTLLNEWARRWVERFTAGEGRFFTSNMEDSGTLHALKFLGEMGRVDPQKILVLRTVSNFTTPPEGESPLSTLVPEGDQEVVFPGFELALENSYRVAGTVIRAGLAGEDPVSGG